jgi:hypothetical protein
MYALEGQSYRIHVFKVDLEKGSYEKINQTTLPTIMTGPTGLSFVNLTKVERNGFRAYEKGIVFNSIPPIINTVKEFYEVSALAYFNAENFLVNPLPVFPSDRRIDEDISKYPLFYRTYSVFNEDAETWYVGEDFSDTIRVYNRNFGNLTKKVSLLTSVENLVPEICTASSTEIENFDIDISCFTNNAQYLPLHINTQTNTLYRVIKGKEEISEVKPSIPFEEEKKYFVEYDLPDLKVKRLIELPSFVNYSPIELKGKYLFQIIHRDSIKEDHLRFIMFD